MKKMVSVGVIGCGTVGQGVVKILSRMSASIERRVGIPVRIVAMCDVRPIFYKGIHCTTSYQELLKNEGIDIVVELIGGYEPARTVILSALRSGKHVVTANKAVLAKYWDEVFTLAQEKGKLVYFEAAVGGAIPVVQTIDEGMAGNHIKKITGILNGTTNYILSEMTRSGIPFKEALSLARFAGFAEANPVFDVDGIDTAHKLAILSSLAWSQWVKISDIEVTGIGNVSDDDVYFAKKEFGYVIKLLGSASVVSNKLELSVEPCMVPNTSTFATVEREYNAVMINGDASGDITLFGKGAGQMPAASAVVSDIIYLARQVAYGNAGQMPYIVYDAKKRMPIVPAEKKAGKYYLRFIAQDRPGVLSRIAGILSADKISIASVYQKEPLPRLQKGVPVLMLTHATTKKNLLRALKRIDRMPIILEKTAFYRIES